MLKDPNLIKRPLIIRDNRAYQGFDEKSLIDFVNNSPANLSIPVVLPEVAPEAAH
jgi:hypothetical protein